MFIVLIPFAHLFFFFFDVYMLVFAVNYIIRISLFFLVSKLLLNLKSKFDLLKLTKKGNMSLEQSSFYTDFHDNNDDDMDSNNLNQIKRDNNNEFVSLHYFFFFK